MSRALHHDAPQETWGWWRSLLRLMRRHPLSSYFILAYLAWLWEVPAYA